jgi:GMP synthase-like glutamine amidotransferase
MRPVAIIQNDAHDGPSYFATWMAARQIPVQVLRMFDGDSLPTHITDCSGLCVLGGPMSTNDALPYFAPLLDLIRDAIAKDVPVIGHCLGGQLMARALGGSVQAAENEEIGWSQLQPVHPQAAQWFGDADPLALFQWHSESFSIPAGATLLVRGAMCHNQAYSVGDKHLGMQFHCEIDDAKVRDWLSVGAAEMQACVSPGAQSAQSVLDSLPGAMLRSHSIADRIYSRWAQGLVR